MEVTGMQRDAQNRFSLRRRAPGWYDQGFGGIACFHPSDEDLSLGTPDSFGIMGPPERLSSLNFSLTRTKEKTHGS
jgi:hypothetical protein